MINDHLTIRMSGLVLMSLALVFLAATPAATSAAADTAALTLEPLAAAGANDGAVTGSSKPKDIVKKKLRWKSRPQEKIDGLRLRDLSFRPNPHLGLAVPGKLTQYYNVMSQAGLGVIRLTVPWSLREPQRGQYDWAGLDEAIKTLNALDMEAFLTLDSDAEWGVLPSDYSAKNHVPRDMADWQDFVRKIVERYDDDGIDDAPGLKRPTRYYQVGNEWFGEDNASGGWTGTTDELIDFFNASHDAVKEADPDAQFILGGIAAINLDILVLASGMADYTAVTGYSADSPVVITSDIQSDPRAQERLLEANRVLHESRFDMADLHLYGPVPYNEARINWLGQQLGGGIKLISSECGGPSLAYDHDKVITPTEHFLAVLDINLHALSRGLDFCLWLRLGEGTSGITWGNSKVPLFDMDRQPKGGYWAYMMLAASLDGMKSVDRIRDGVYRIRREDKAPIFIAWATPSETTYQLPADAHPTRMITITDAAQGLYEIQVPPADGLLQLNELPLVISENLPGGAYVAGDNPDLTPRKVPSGLQK